MTKEEAVQIAIDCFGYNESCRDKIDLLDLRSAEVWVYNRLGVVNCDCSCEVTDYNCNCFGCNYDRAIVYRVLCLDKYSPAVAQEVYTVDNLCLDYLSVHCGYHY